MYSCAFHVSIPSKGSSFLKAGEYSCVKESFHSWLKSLWPRFPLLFRGCWATTSDQQRIALYGMIGSLTEPISCWSWLQDVLLLHICLLNASVKMILSFLFNSFVFTRALFFTYFWSYQMRALTRVRKVNTRPECIQAYLLTGQMANKMFPKTLQIKESQKSSCYKCTQNNFSHEHDFSSIILSELKTGVYVTFLFPSLAFSRARYMTSQCKILRAFILNSFV